MNDIKLPLKTIGDDIITDFEGTKLAKILIETNPCEMCEYFVEVINQGTMLLLENEELKNKNEKLTDIMKKMEVINASSEELIEMLSEPKEGD